jgi:hypothetical protein
METVTRIPKGNETFLYNGVLVVVYEFFACIYRASIITKNNGKIVDDKTFTTWQEARNHAFEIIDENLHILKGA